LPLVFKDGQSVESLGLTGAEVFTIKGVADITPRGVLTVMAVKEDYTTVEFEVVARLDTEVDVDYFKHGGILPFVLRKLIAD
jgi:aconitate hydratase